MISSVHYITLYINGQLAEIKSQEELQLKINNLLFSPTKVQTKTAEYSYSFSLPTTKQNKKIFEYADNLSKLNKFHNRYKAEVHADGKLVFDGSLTLNKVTKDEFSCNLVNIKINSLEDIFGEMTMTDLKWMVDYQGVPTINAINSATTTDYFFPFASYGVFQKEPYFEDEVSGEYTPKNEIDKYNKFWHVSFPPSIKILEAIRKAYEQKGYKVNGNAFADPILNSIYCTPNYATDQSPNYNVGNSKFGKVNITTTWDNLASMNEKTDYENGSRNGYFFSTGGWCQDLNFPYERVKPAINASNKDAEPEYNFSAVNIWNMMDSKYNAAVNVNVNEKTYMFDPGEQVVVIPADGWYKVRLWTNVALIGYGTTFQADQWTTTYYADDEFKERQINIKKDLFGQTPIEIQLVKNYDENVELIKGKTNVEWKTGDPNSPTYIHHQGVGYDTYTYIENKKTWTTEFPHQALFGSDSPTKTEDLVPTVLTQRRTVAEGDDGSGFYQGGSRSGQGGGGTFGGHSNVNADNPAYYASESNSYGYVHQGIAMPYDVAVSNSFICGFSSMNGPTIGIQKNGKSWSKMTSEKGKILANVQGMKLIGKGEDGQTYEEQTDYCKNEYRNSSTFMYGSGWNINGEITCCVYLKKNDILELLAVQRDFNGQKYGTSGSCNLVIEAISERSEEELRADANFGYTSPTEFPYELNLFNFQNKETKVSDWISSILTAYNLSATQIGNEIFINKNKTRISNSTAIDIDNRVSSDEAESEKIEYSREMAIKYKVNKDEYGFELTIPNEHINDEDWFNYGDSGYTVIKLNDDSYVTDTQTISTNFSYNWYMPFLWKEVTSGGTETGTEVNIQLPVISLSQYMVEGYDYAESAKHDGFSLTQRFWFKQPISEEYLWMSDNNREKVYLSYPVNAKDGVNISYKTDETSIATEYFNITPLLSSNIVTVNAYLSPEEYSAILGGCLIHYDSDLYIPTNITFDPSGRNKAEIKMIKKL